MGAAALKLRPADWVLPVDEIAAMLRTLDVGTVTVRAS
jgi:hypothetical protein